MEDNIRHGLAEELTRRVMGGVGGIGPAPVEFSELGLSLSIAAAEVEKAHQSLSYEAIGTLGKLLASPLIQFPDMTREGADKVLGPVAERGGQRLALATVAWGEAGEAARIASLTDCSGDGALRDLAFELERTAACGGDVRIADASGLDDALARQVEAGRATPAAAARLAGALASAEATLSGEGSPAGRVGELEREIEGLRLQLGEMRAAQKAAADSIDMAVPDPADDYLADRERTAGMRPVTPEDAARDKALADIRARLAEIGLLADEEAVEASNTAWRRAADEPSERRALEAIVTGEEMDGLVSCLRAAVSLGSESGTGTISGGVCEAALPVVAGCYLSYDPAREEGPVRTLKVYPGAGGTTAFDAQPFRSLACGYEHLVGRPEAGDPSLAALREIDDAVFGLAPGPGYEEPPVWTRAFEQAQCLYSASRGVMVHCSRAGDGPSSRRLVCVTAGVEPGQLAAARAGGKTVLAALDDGSVGSATMLTDLTRGEQVEGMGPDIARIGALVAADRGEGWVAGGDEAIFTAAEDELQRGHALEVAEERAELEPQGHGGFLSFFRR